jgi:hypothetical protein
MNVEQVRDALKQHVDGALDLWSKDRPRHAQTLSKTVGASDIGGCREYVRRLIAGVEFSDEQSTWAADMGTAAHLIIDEAIGNAFGAGLALSDQRFIHYGDGDDPVVAQLPSGFTIPGHPDGCYPDLGLVPDWKTKNGLATIRRTGPSEQNWWQVHLYALGLWQDGVFGDRPLSEVIVSLVYFDRSGKDDNHVVFAEPFDETKIIAIDQWLEDPIYAVKVGEVAMKDKPVTWCEAACPYFTDCRTEDIQVEGGLITDPVLVDMLRQYLDAHDAEKEAKQLKAEAKNELEGVAGSSGEATIKWTRINESEIAASYRAPYDRINIRRIK